MYSQKRLVAKLARATKLTQAQVRSFYQAFGDAMIEILMEGDHVYIPGLGCWYRTPRAVSFVADTDQILFPVPIEDTSLEAQLKGAEEFIERILRENAGTDGLPKV